ncbi:S-adenosylmethionine:tRNA ribosyltransferase-isomerase [Deferribacterales bacterium]|nr:S-adenosylmethionine:tRNA ribosyltransferase-isomerase [Deferribacterales bacterium]
MSNDYEYDLDALTSYDYELPDELIAQTPPDTRGASRLLHINKTAGVLADKQFSDIVNLLDDSYFLVVNDTRVLPARLPAHKQTGGRTEVFALETSHNGDIYSALALVRGHFATGTHIKIGATNIIELTEQQPDGSWLIRSQIPINELIRMYGTIPLPPYIRRTATDDDRLRYQTIYAAQDGSVAAPTAGLHFTDDIIAALTARGVSIKHITLHVGIGTFRPIKTERLSEHTMHREYYSIDEHTASEINALKRSGKQLIAVGTTSVRALESATDERGVVQATDRGSTDIFIKQGYKFKVVDGMLTNFHLPKSSLIVLVSALVSYKLCMSAYKHAVNKHYRFFSYGDAMLIMP